ncbi:hypothetical protein ABGB17_20365 [Sphaerisporangium sp. B11E5]|uniref:hypothetical protein n=1 Tax=Sphaerisporangium sp. B11E5 TaxID=3153563 RepID=UPI00325E773C
MGLPKVSRGMGVRHVPFGDHQEVPELFTLTWHDPDGVAPSLRMEFAVRDGVPQCREIHIVATSDGRQVQSSDARGLKVEDYLEYAISRVAWHVEVADDGTRTAVMRDVPDDVLDAVRHTRVARTQARRKLTPELLREVAKVYRLHVDGNPTKAVADHFGLASDRTARHWVKAARAAGELGESIRGKAGEL